jgi:predicted ATPase
VDPTFLERVSLANYKSIAACDVRLGSLTFLVGPNGAGKSNFLDALRFVADSLRTSLDHALRDRGGIREVRRRSSGRPTHFGMRLGFRLRDGSTGHYAFRVGARRQGGFEVQQEECQIAATDGTPWPFFSVRDGALVASSMVVAPPVASDRLYLVNAAGVADFRPVYDAFSRMGFYNLNPDKIRELQSPDDSDLLARDGSNITSVLRQIASEDPSTKKRIEEYLSVVVQGVSSVDVKAISNKETLEFRQEIAGTEHPWRFVAGSMSDGTLRALGVLVAVFQASRTRGLRVPLVGIEEPEVALHPAAAGALLDSLRDASHSTQVIVTTHSPDVLDDDSLPAESLLAVTVEKGVTNIGPLDQAGVVALEEHMYTAGELLRMNQLSPSPSPSPAPTPDRIPIRVQLFTV